ncbi:hypothetical protein OSSY52_02910 [Tepiditoga spiralis]|uniref:ABC transporter permease n=1 Tax=Tepiditoga spiralis TaxID=2108365 RepID=A0A7G1G1P8_9BACT|nr:ABC transporter permease subunit [Tepiditoga spiralis]BBE30150.1 hypothetical protein OSSY52_02910 [Tepiditoga spiralis]
MNLFKKDFKYNFRSLLIWSIIIFSFSLLYIPFTEKILSDSGQMVKMLNKLPKIFLKSFNIDTESFSTPEGFFGSEGMSFIFILTGLFSATLSGSLFAKEFENKTIEYLLIKPFSRVKIFIQKYLVLISNIIILNLIFNFSTLYLFSVFVSSEYDKNILLGFGLYVFTVELFFGALGVLFSILFQKSNLTTTLSLGILFIMYFGETTVSEIKSIEPLAKLSIFHYMPLIETVKNHKIYLNNSIVIILISFIIMYISLKIFEKKNILI